MHPGCHIPDCRHGNVRLLQYERQAGEQGRADGKRHVGQGRERNDDPRAVKDSVEPGNDGIERPSPMLGYRIAGGRDHQHGQRRRGRGGRGWSGATNGTAQELLAFGRRAPGMREKVGQNRPRGFAGGHDWRAAVFARDPPSVEPGARKRLGMAISDQQPSARLAPAIDGARHQLVDRRTQVHMQHFPDRDRITPEKMGGPRPLIGCEFAIEARRRDGGEAGSRPHVRAKPRPLACSGRNARPGDRGRRSPKRRSA